MTLWTEAARATYAAYRLARFDRGGLALLDSSREGAARSFWAAAWVAPAWLLLILLEQGVPDGVGLGWFLLVQVVGYVLNWTAFPVVMAEAARRRGQLDKFYGYLAAYNWSTVIQVLVYLPPALLARSGLVAADAAQAIGQVVMFAVLVYQGFIAYAALEIDVLAAIGIVFLDVLIGFLIEIAIEGVLGS